MRFSWMLAATVLLILATGVRCKRKFDGDFEFAEEVSRDIRFAESHFTLSRSPVARRSRRQVDRSLVFYFFLSSGSRRRNANDGCPSVWTIVRSGPQLFAAGMRRVRSLSDGILIEKRRCHTIGSGNNNSGDSAGGWRFAVANCCETITF